MASCEQRFDSKKGTLMRIKAHEISIRTFKSTAEKHNMCEVCKRPFKGNERQQFLEMQVRDALVSSGLVVLIYSEKAELQRHASRRCKQRLLGCIGKAFNPEHACCMTTARAE